MGYFSAAALDDIRDDPSSIVAISAATRTQFISDLGMPGLSDGAYQAAFCTVLSYELAPYGAGLIGNDLDTLLASSTFACNNYVSVAWQLLDLLGVSTEDEAGLGWDGGAVGNHTQLLYDDGQSQLLLDPTIGLVVNDVTLDGLINGTEYTDLASFYSRNDIISAFNATVINAVEHGSYQVWDAIYYVPGLDEWLYNYFGHLGLTIDHGNDSQTIVGYITGDNIDSGPGDDLVYGGLGNDHLDGGSGVDFAVFAGSRFDYSIYNSGLAQATVIGPAGTDGLQNVEALQFDDQVVPLPVAQVVQTDTSDQFVWASITTNRDWYGNAIDILYQNDDGSSSLYQYDSLDQFAWNRIQTFTDPRGHVTKQLYNQNDGSHISYIYDANNSGDWARITSYLTSDWQAFSKQIYDEDDGSHVMYLYDVNNTGASNSIESYFTADWTQVKHLYHQDDGTHVLYQYDLNDSYTWASLQTNYDANFHRVSELLAHDDGTHSVLQFDSANQLAAASNYGADWNVIA